MLTREELKYVPTLTHVCTLRNINVMGEQLEFNVSSAELHQSKHQM